MWETFFFFVDCKTSEEEKSSCFFRKAEKLQRSATCDLLLEMA